MAAAGRGADWVAVSAAPVGRETVPEASAEPVERAAGSADSVVRAVTAGAGSEARAPEAEAGPGVAVEREVAAEREVQVPGASEGQEVEEAWAVSGAREAAAAWEELPAFRVRVPVG
jgi:hypothetical protein